MRRTDAIAFLATAIAVVAANAVAAVAIGCLIQALGHALSRSSMVARLPAPLRTVEAREAES